MPLTAKLGGFASPRHSPPEDRAASGLQRLAGAHPLALILAIGLAFRAALLLTPRSYFPDEIFQYLDPAHRLAFGTGVVTWEYRFNVRGWLVPVLLAGPMWLGDWISPAGGAYLLCVKIALILLSLAPVAAAFAIGGRLSRRHAIAAALVMALWSETALFGTQALTEAIATWIALPATALIVAPTRTSDRHWLAAGALLALATVIRFQYGPALALFAALCCGRAPRRWVALVAGGAVVLALSAALDVRMGQAPFGWIVHNIQQNIVAGRSHRWTDGPFFYATALGASFGLLLVPLGLLAWRGSRRFPALIACALVNIAVHTLIAHKEYRYILLSTTLLLLLAAIGTVDLVDARRASGQRTPSLPITMALWGVASLVTVGLDYPARAWSRATPALEAFSALRSTPRLCGVALAGEYWADAGGYAYLHRPVPMLVPDGERTPPAQWLPRAAPAFNAIVAPATLAHALPAAYRPAACFAGGLGAATTCVFLRPGGCDRTVARDREINRVLARLDL